MLQRKHILATFACVAFVLSACIYSISENPANQNRTANSIKNSAREIVAEYGSLPKGVILEGAAEGFEKITSVSYEKFTNRFVINGKTFYDSPVPQENLAELLEALQKDRRIGISLSKREDVLVFGTLSKRSSSVAALVAADRLLGYVTFGRVRKLRGIKLPGNYEPKQVRKRTIDAVCSYNFKDYVFKLDDNRYVRDNMRIQMTLIPISKKRSAQGGFLPDMEAAEKGLLEEADKANVAHINQYLYDYMAMSPVQGAVNHGEVVSFLRLLIKSKVDTKKLLQEITAR